MPKSTGDEGGGLLQVLSRADAPSTAPPPRRPAHHPHGASAIVANNPSRQAAVGWAGARPVCSLILGRTRTRAELIGPLLR